MKTEFQNVYKIYRNRDGTDKVVLADISFSMEKGDFVTVIGESGCGKTTLLNLLAGLDLPTRGKIFADGVEVCGLHPSRSMLFQQPALLPWLSVKKNVAYGCRLRGDLEQLDYRVHQFLEMMGLSGFEDLKPDALSLGMAQRVCLARALVGRADMLLLDEPFASLDTFTRSHIQEELINIWLSEEFTALFVTHDIDEAILMGNKIVLISGSPGVIRDVFEINIPYPRSIDAPDFKRYRREILNSFKRAYLGEKYFESI